MDKVRKFVVPLPLVIDKHTNKMEQKQTLKGRIEALEAGETLVLDKKQERTARTYASELNYLTDVLYSVSRDRSAGTFTITRVR